MGSSIQQKRELAFNLTIGRQHWGHTLIIKISALLFQPRTDRRVWHRSKRRQVGGLDPTPIQPQARPSINPSDFSAMRRKEAHGNDDDDVNQSKNEPWLISFFNRDLTF